MYSDRKLETYLLRETNQCTLGVNKKFALDCPGGTETPTRTTYRLIYKTNSFGLRDSCAKIKKSTKKYL